MDEKREWELRLKMRAGIPLTISEEKELGLIEEIPRLSPEDRVRKFEAACKMFGIKPSQILGSKENEP